MQIPIYSAQVQAQPDPGAVRGDMRAAGQGGAALAQAADQIGGDLARFAEAQANARRASQLTAATGSAARALQDAVVGAESDTDYATLPQRFKTTLGEIRDRHLKSIEDPVVQGLFARDFERLSLPQEMAVRHDARKREIDDMGAKLDDTLQTFVPLAAAARDPEARQNVIDQARLEIERNAQLGIVSRADAGKRERAFLGRVGEAQVLARLNDARNAGDGDKADAVMADLMVGRYPGLDEVAKERMIRTAQRQRDALRADAVARQDKIERDAERQMREGQTRAAADLMLRMDQDPAAVRPIDLQDALKRQQIGPEDYRMLATRLDGRTTARDVSAVEGDLRARMVREGADVYDAVVAARNNGQLSQPTADALIRDNQAALQSREKEPWKNAAQKRAHDFVRTFIAGDNPMVNLNETQSQRLALALRDLQRHPEFQSGDADAAARQVVGRYVDEIKVGLRSDYFGEADISTAAGIARAGARLRDLVKIGVLKPEELAAELDKLEQARAVLGAPGKPNVKPPGATR